MATKLSIWNRALRKIGELRISGLTEDSVNQRLLSDNYEEDKLAVLEMHSWKFARKQVSLALNSIAPLNGYANSFELPSDFIKIVDISNTDPNYRNTPNFTTMGTTLHTDESTAVITYVSSTTPEGNFSAGFVEALSIFMAANVVYARTKSQPLMDRMDQKFERSLSRAKTADAAGDRTPGPSALSYPNICARFTGTRSSTGRIS